MTHLLTDACGSPSETATSSRTCVSMRVSSVFVRLSMRTEFAKFRIYSALWERHYVGESGPRRSSARKRSKSG